VFLIFIVGATGDAATDFEGVCSTDVSEASFESRVAEAIQPVIAIQAIVAAIAPNPTPELKIAQVGQCHTA
jgi:hypothetical protein